MRKILFGLGVFLSTGSFGQQVNFQSAFQIGGMYEQDIQDVHIDTAGNFFVVGGYHYDTDFDPGAGTFILTSSSSSSISNGYLASYDSTNHLRFAVKFNVTGSSGYVQPSYVKTDNLGNIYISGDFIDYVDFDPGTGINELYALYPHTGFIVKLSPTGAFIWAHAFDGARVGRIMLDVTGNLTIVGLFDGTVDFDPGTGTFELNETSSFGSDIYILRLDNSGNFVWAKQVGGDHEDEIKDVSTDLVGNIYIAGDFAGTADYDPGPATHTVTATGTTRSLFVLKLNNSGSFVWFSEFKTGDPLAGDAGFAMQIDHAHGVYLAGPKDYSMDADPGAGVYSMPTSGSIGFLIKLDATGAFSWAKNFSGSALYTLKEIAVDQNDNLYFGGYFEGSMDFDPDAGIYNLSSTDMFDSFMAKYSAAGNFKWAKQIAGTNDQYLTALEVDSAGKIIAAGNFFGTTDFDPGVDTFELTPVSSPSYAADVFITSYSQDICGDFTLSFDSISPVRCILPGYASVAVAGGTAPYTYSWNTIPVDYDSTASFYTAGVYSIQVADDSGCVITRGILIDGIDSSLYGYFDLDVNLVMPMIRKDIPRILHLDALNRGCYPVSGTVSVILDPLLAFTGSIPAPDIVSGDTLKWNFTGLTYDLPHIVSEIEVTTTSAASIGDSVTVQILISPMDADEDTSNNQKSYRLPVVNSYDPNIKQVCPEGICDEHRVKAGQTMTYTVQFQNTGNAEAVNIYVLDTLDSNLDINSIRIVSNSHVMTTEIFTGNVLKFKFDNINLADSTSDEAHSHGYFVYEVDQLPVLGTGTVLNNTAYIYFDLNEPIITNTVSNMVVPDVSSCIDFSLIKEQENLLELKLFPNPSTGHITIVSDKMSLEKISIIDLSGRTVMNLKPATTVSNLDVSSLQNGIYLVKVQINGGTSTVKLVKE